MNEIIMNKSWKSFLNINNCKNFLSSSFKATTNIYTVCNFLSWESPTKERASYPRNHSYEKIIRICCHGNQWWLLDSRPITFRSLAATITVKMIYLSTCFVRQRCLVLDGERGNGRRVLSWWNTHLFKQLNHFG